MPESTEPWGRGNHPGPQLKEQVKPLVRWCIQSDQSCQSEFCLKEMACYQAVSGSASSRDINEHYLKAQIINEHLLRKSNEDNPEQVARDFLRRQPKS